MSVLMANGLNAWGPRGLEAVTCFLHLLFFSFIWSTLRVIREKDDSYCSRPNGVQCQFCALVSIDFKLASSIHVA